MWGGKKGLRGLGKEYGRGKGKDKEWVGKKVDGE